VAAGGLFFAIFNEVLQFFLIWFGALLIPSLGLNRTGGWKGMVARNQQNFRVRITLTLGARLAVFRIIRWHALDCIVFGLGAVQAMGYWTTTSWWCTRAFGEGHPFSQDGADHRFLFQDGCALIVFSGLLGLAVLPMHLVPRAACSLDQYCYNEVLPLMLARYCGPACWGSASLLWLRIHGGHGGNVSAFAPYGRTTIYRPSWQDRARSTLRFRTLVHFNWLVVSIGTPISRWVLPASWITAGAVRFLHRAVIRHGIARMLLESG